MTSLPLELADRNQKTSASSGRQRGATSCVSHSHMDTRRGLSRTKEKQELCVAVSRAHAVLLGGGGGGRRLLGNHPAGRMDNIDLTADEGARPNRKKTPRHRHTNGHAGNTTYTERHTSRYRGRQRDDEAR